MSEILDRITLLHMLRSKVPQKYMNFTYKKVIEILQKKKKTQKMHTKKGTKLNLQYYMGYVQVQTISYYLILQQGFVQFFFHIFVYILYIY